MAPEVLIVLNDNNSSGGGCYLTTACLKHFSEQFDDICHELTVLRWFQRGKCGMSLFTFMSLCSVLSVSADYLLFGLTGEGSLPFSIDEQISRLSEPERIIVEQQLNLILRAFSLNPDNE